MVNAVSTASNAGQPTVVVLADNDALRAVVQRALETASLDDISVDNCGRALAVEAVNG